ncbi:sulfatase-like hydrolase/transferase [Planctomicrobium sp. SH664]|uniref:sulfatase family protein n=1 Tax=Planctomicrobium sp. SH664 TaxID=3448125 RepID=UPI003F5B25C7
MQGNRQFSIQLSLMAITLAVLGQSTFLSAADNNAATSPTPPNIILINADDLGYGDVGAYGSQRIPTPNIDRLAAAGLRFTNAYTTAATCTPSRYSLMTGEYAWRRQGTGVLPGDAALIIPPGSTTLPSVLQSAGYRTGVVGKWHLGLGTDQIDWNNKIAPGPLQIGFDEAFIMAATGDRVPCVYLKNDRIVGLDPADPIAVDYSAPFPGEPTGKTHPELLKMHPSHGHDMAIVNGISRIGYLKGGRAALWKDEEMADTFTAAAVEFLKQHQQDRFFLYFALHDPHVPRVPHPRFVGKTTLGPRGDAIVQADWCVGEVLNALARLNLTSKTLVIFTSDNGPVVDDGYQDDAVAKLGDHRPAGILRGGKYSRFEAGTRVPFIVSWPGRVRTGTSAAQFSQVDLLSSLATLAQQPIDPSQSRDSRDHLPVLLGDSQQGREEIIGQASGGLTIRVGRWKFIPSSKGQPVTRNTRIETGNSPNDQLYDLDADPGETNNVADQHPELVKDLKRRLEAIQKSTAPRKQR